MDIVLIVSFLSGLAFFLFGMSMMGEAIKKIAGNKMQLVLGRLTSSRIKGIGLGTFVTAIIQSSSATSVMVVSFVSAGIMTLTQAIGVVMGANIGTTATGWILTLADIEGAGALGRLFSTTFLFGVVAVIGIALYMFANKASYKHIGLVLVSLAVLMNGMKLMSGAMEPLQSSEAFMRMMGAVDPLLCVLIGIVSTAVVQSCSASIGILQAMSMTGIIPYSVAVPMVVGMSIGACVPVLLSAITASKDGKRTALSYLYFNVFGGAVFLAIYAILSVFPKANAFFSQTVNSYQIAIVNTLFKVFAVAVLYPFIPHLEKLVRLSIKDSGGAAAAPLDEMLLNYPAQAIERSSEIIGRMAQIAVSNMNTAMDILFDFDKKKYEQVLKLENEQDKYEDILGSFLVKLNARELSDTETHQSAKYLRCITDLERISDHAENIAGLAKENYDEGKQFSQRARFELGVCATALREIMSMTFDALIHDNIQAAYCTEPLEEVIDAMTEKLKQNHIRRLQKGGCSLSVGFVFNDCINNFERIADHCSNISVAVIELHNLSASTPHQYLRTVKMGISSPFQQHLNEFDKKYSDMLKEADGMGEDTACNV